MGARILVADDSVTIQKVVELTFSKEDFVLVQARSGEEAIRKAMEVRPDLALVDLVMPDKNGYEVCAALRAEPALRSLPIILLTGTFETFDKERGLQAGANDFVTKPFESQTLISKVKQLLFARMLERVATAPASGSVRAGAPRVESAPMVAPHHEPRSEVEAPAPALPAVSASEPEPGRPSPEDPSLSWPAASEPPPLDLPELEPADLAEAGEGAGEDKVRSLPDSLCLEDLLFEPPTLVTMPKIEPRPGGIEEVGPAEPVFDLTTDVGSPPPTLVEVGAVEPPALSTVDLLDSVTVEVPGPIDPATEVPELDLVSVAEGVADELLPSATPSDFDGVMDLETSAEKAPEWSETPAPHVSQRESAEMGEPPLGDDWTIAADSPIDQAVPETPPVTAAGEVAALTAHSGLLAAPIPSDLSAMQGTIPFPPDVATSGMASMRQAVTERVARDLARELSDRLVERIEKIVWEVVPDLAEILITKEIERIRAVAEDKQSS